MPKPTLLQSLFKQPTQTYSNLPAERNGSASHTRGKRYHSVRNDMVRVAARASAEQKIPAPVFSYSLPPQHQLHLSSSLPHYTRPEHEEAFSSPPAQPRVSDLQNDKAAQDLRTDPASGAMGAPLEQPTLRALMDKEASAFTSEGVIAKQADTGSVNDVDEGNDNVIPTGVDVSTPAGAGPSIPLPHFAEPSNDDTDEHHEVASNSTRTSNSNSNGRPDPARRGSSSFSMASSSASLDESSNTSEASWPTSFSASAPSTSTRATTPATSDSGYGQSHPRSSSMTTRSGSGDSSSVRRKRTSEHRKSMLSTVTTYTDDDWAKDVRWLVSPTESPTTMTGTNLDKRKSWHSVSKAPGLATIDATGTTTPTTITPTTKRSRARTQFELDPKMTLIPMLLPGNGPIQMQAPHRRVVSQGAPKSRRMIGKRRMSAVWEEDEGDESTPNSPRRVHTDPAPLSSLGRARSLSSPQRSKSPTGSASLRSGESASLAPSSSPSSAFTSASRTVDLPNPLPVTNGGTPTGFTSLVLPRAAHSPSKRYTILFGNSSHVDITRSGLAQTTMSTISITKNAASSALGGSRPRFLSLSSLSLLSPGSGSKSDLPKTPSHLLGSLPRPLNITSHTRPPSKVNSHQILVQMYAVAVDGLDDRIVSEKSARKDCYGFVPGRAFVGRAVEVGFEVNNVAKGEWIIGLLDVRKCGALAEFVIVEKRRVARCPRPSPTLTLEQLALLPLCGVPAHRAVRTAGIDADTERDAARGRALVLHGHDGVGAMAVQALAYAGMHVTAHIPLHADTRRFRTPSTSSASSTEPSDEREHDNHVGIQLQPSSTRDAEERVRRWGARGVRVGDAVEVVENCDASAFDLVIDTVGGKRIWDACQRVLAGGGQFTTIIGDVALPSPSYPSPPASSDSSPSGSSRSNSPFFPNRHSSSNKKEPGSNSNHDNKRAVPSINQHFKANLRSLRRAFKARKAIGYALVSPVADVDQYGEDVRDSLVEAVRRAVAGVFVPFVGNKYEEEHEVDEDEDEDENGDKRRVVPFERAPELFGCGRLSEGRTGVVRVVD